MVVTAVLTTATLADVLAGDFAGGVLGLSDDSFLLAQEVFAELVLLENADVTGRFGVAGADLLGILVATTCFDGGSASSSTKVSK